MLLVLSSLPPCPNTCRLGLAPGARTPLPQGLGPAQRSLRSEDFLHLRNMKKGYSSPFASSTTSQAHSCPRHCTACLGGQPAPLPTLVCESLASTKYGGHCVPALVTQWYCEEQSVYVFFGSETILFSVTDQ